jgi:hypothetical protein
MSMIPSFTGSGHKWRFFRAGDFDQVRLDTGADLAKLHQLDQKLWVALACPTRGLEFDIKTLDLIDTDKDGRIRAPEIIAATRWACDQLKNPDDLLRGAEALPLSAINDATDSGRQLLASARQILGNLGKADTAFISPADTADTAKIFAQTKFNGDGIVPADSAPDAETQQVIADAIACLGTESDRSGKPGISKVKLDAFFKELGAYAAWAKRAQEDASILALGDATAAASAAIKAVRIKVDDYFGRCRLAAFDARATAALNREEKEYLALGAKDLTINASEVTGFPLAHVEASRPLPLKEGVNPAWAAALDTFRSAAVAPVFGADKPTLTETDWTQLTTKIAAYDAWQATKAGAAVEKLGLARVEEILASSAQAGIAELIQQDFALAAEFEQINAVDRLARYHRDLAKLLNNFVSFRDFYSRRDKAIFQAGTLFLDQRSCELCLTVEDAAKHAAMAGLAGAYLAYCDCVRKSTGEKLSIVAAFTDGDSDNLMPGRNGIFYDRKGRDYDATITKIIDNPISIRQAFWSPYKKLVRLIEENVAKRAAAADAEANTKLAETATQVAQADRLAKPAPPAKVEPKKVDVGMVAAMGVAFGSISTFLATVFTKFVDLSLVEILLVFAGIVLLISGPAMLIAYLKLRKRNLGPILDANGWAVNAKARVNVPFGASLTSVAALPAGSERDLTDPFAEKKSPWPSLIVLALILFLTYKVLDGMGYVSEWTDGRLGTPRPVQKVDKPSSRQATKDLKTNVTKEPAPEAAK